MEKHPITLEITERAEAAAGIIALRLRSADGAQLPQWQAGAHITVSCGDEGLLERQYSLCSDPSDRSSWRIAIRLDKSSRGGSAWLHEHARQGISLQATTPSNHFPLEPAPCYHFIAGGIGITPILPMLLAAESQGANWSLHYRGRDRTRMAFVNELLPFGDRVSISTRAEQGDWDVGEYLSALSTEDAVYACGPASMLDHITLEAEKRLRSPVRVERFTPAEVDTTTDRAFEVEFSLSGIRAEVPADASVLGVAESHGIQVLNSCREGTCGSCETVILEGEAEHRDSVLSAAEQAEQSCMLVCVSRAAKNCALLRLEL